MRMGQKLSHGAVCPSTAFLNEMAGADTSLPTGSLLQRGKKTGIIPGTAGAGPI